MVKKLDASGEPIRGDREIDEAQAIVVRRIFEQFTSGVGPRAIAKALFSGLIHCGVCGGPYSLRGQDRYACSAHVANGSCANSRTIARAALEERVLAGLKDRMMAPEMAAEAMRAYAEERNRLNRERRANGDGWRIELTKVEKAIAAMIAAIEEGLYQPSMKARMEELEHQKADLIACLAEVPADVPDILPNMSGAYRKKVQRLAAALNNPKDRSEAAEAIRGLIEKIALRPGPQSGRDRRDLARRPGHDPELDRSASYWHKRKNRHPLSGSRGNVGLGGCGGAQPA